MKRNNDYYVILHHMTLDSACVDIYNNNYRSGKNPLLLPDAILNCIKKDNEEEFKRWGNSGYCGTPKNEYVESFMRIEDFEIEYCKEDFINNELVAYFIHFIIYS